MKFRVKCSAIVVGFMTFFLGSSFLVSSYAGIGNDGTPRSDSALLDPKPSKRLFEIPVFPGTVPFNETPGFNRLQPPFATTLRVYRTTDGGSLDKGKVIAFYQDYLTAKGWKEAIFKRQGDEGYAGLGLNLFENINGTRVHLSGNFSLWVAPKDGMYTILLDEWRLSSLNQATMNYISGAVGSLETIGTKRGYRVQKVYSDGDWSKYYENEYLIDRVRFSFIANEASGPHPGDGQLISVTILTYRDPAIAEDEAKLLLPAPSEATDGKQIVVLPTRSVSRVFVKNSTVFLIQDYSGKQEENIKFIAGELEKL